MYYAQTIIDILIISILFIQCRFRSTTANLRAGKARRGGIKFLTMLSLFINSYNIYQLVLLSMYLSDVNIIEVTKHDEHGAGFLQWYQLCQILFDARRFFWFMLAFVILFLSVTALIISSVLVSF